MLVNNPGPTRKWMNKCYGSSYWAQFKTVQRHLLTWQQISRKKIYYPFSYDTAAGIVLYMMENLQVSPNTLYGYVATMKAMHDYQGFPVLGLEDRRLKLLLCGYKHTINSIHQKVNTRKVMTFETLQLFGNELCDAPYDYETKQAVWTAMVFSFWGSVRVGDFMPGSQGVVDIKLVTWDRIQMTDNDHAAVFLASPKEDREGTGVTKDIIRYHEQVYCPIYNMEHLLETRLQRRPVDFKEPLFLNSKDRLVNMSFLRKCLSILDRYFGGYGKITCHSAWAGIPSHADGLPDVFNQQEILHLGNWKDGDAYKRYCRTHSLGKIRLLRKVASTYR